MNISWLLEKANIPIVNNLNENKENYTELLQNSEVQYWISRISERSQSKYLGDIHGSHDYRMENILGKCWILGLSRKIDQFAENIMFILDYLNKHINYVPEKGLSFGTIYHYRDQEKVLCSFLPFLGYHDDRAVVHITKQRIECLYKFTCRKYYDVYVDGASLKGVKKEWQPYIINPDLYADGHISLPDMHDMLLFAGMYSFLSNEDRDKVEVIVSWLFGDAYQNIISRYGYFYIPGGSYSAKAVIFKLHLLDFQSAEFTELPKAEFVSLIFNVFVLSHFKSARESEWFLMALTYLERYRLQSGHYRFPSYMISEKPDSYVIMGGHMNVGENKRNKQYHEILSTYWMERIYHNIVNQ